MLYRPGFLSLSSISVIFSDIDFRVSGSSSNILLYAIFILRGSVAGYVVGVHFVGCIECRLCLVHIHFCSLLLSSALVLWF